MACKKEKVPRSTKEIAAIFNIDIQDMTKGCKKFKEIFRLNNIEITKNNSSNPLDYIERFCSNLQILDDVNMFVNLLQLSRLVQIIILLWIIHPLLLLQEQYF